jgi:hypothetical protein
MFPRKTSGTTGGRISGTATADQYHAQILGGMISEYRNAA